VVASFLDFDTGVLTFPVTLQRMQAIARRHSQIFKACSQYGELDKKNPPKGGWRVLEREGIQVISQSCYRRYRQRL